MRELDGEDLLLSPAALRGDVPGDATDDGPHARLGEDDPLDGGDLLDAFRNDVRTCEAIGIDWTRREPTAEDLGLEAGDAGDAPDLREPRPRVRAVARAGRAGPGRGVPRRRGGAVRRQGRRPRTGVSPRAAAPRRGR